MLHPAYNTNKDKISMIKMAKEHFRNTLAQVPSKPDHRSGSEAPRQLGLSSPMTNPRATRVLPKVAPTQSARIPVLLPDLTRAYAPPPVAVFVHATCRARWQTILDEVTFYRFIMVKFLILILIFR